MKELKRMSDNGSAKMSDVEGLCNVGRGVVEDYGLSLSVIRRAVIITLRENLGDNSL